MEFTPESGFIYDFEYLTDLRDPASSEFIATYVGDDSLQMVPVTLTADSGFWRLVERILQPAPSSLEAPQTFIFESNASGLGESSFQVTLPGTVDSTAGTGFFINDLLNVYDLEASYNLDVDNSVFTIEYTDFSGSQSIDYSLSFITEAFGIYEVIEDELATDRGIFFLDSSRVGKQLAPANLEGGTVIETQSFSISTRYVVGVGHGADSTDGQEGLLYLDNFSSTVELRDFTYMALSGNVGQIAFDDGSGGTLINLLVFDSPNGGYLYSTDTFSPGIVNEERFQISYQSGDAPVPATLTPGMVFDGDIFGADFSILIGEGNVAYELDDFEDGSDATPVTYTWTVGSDYLALLTIDRTTPVTEQISYAFQFEGDDFGTVLQGLEDFANKGFFELDQRPDPGAASPASLSANDRLVIIEDGDTMPTVLTIQNGTQLTALGGPEFSEETTFNYTYTKTGANSAAITATIPGVITFDLIFFFVADEGGVFLADDGETEPSQSPFLYFPAGLSNQAPATIPVGSEVQIEGPYADISILVTSSTGGTGTGYFEDEDNGGGPILVNWTYSNITGNTATFNLTTPDLQTDPINETLNLNFISNIVGQFTNTTDANDSGIFVIDNEAVGTPSLPETLPIGTRFELFDNSNFNFVEFTIIGASGDSRSLIVENSGQQQLIGSFTFTRLTDYTGTLEFEYDNFGFIESGEYFVVAEDDFGYFSLENPLDSGTITGRGNVSLEVPAQAVQFAPSQIDAESAIGLNNTFGGGDLLFVFQTSGSGYRIVDGDVSVPIARFEATIERVNGLVMLLDIFEAGETLELMLIYLDEQRGLYELRDSEGTLIESGEFETGGPEMIQSV